jgi:hypothetical protein
MRPSVVCPPAGTHDARHAMNTAPDGRRDRHGAPALGPLV